MIYVWRSFVTTAPPLSSQQSIYTLSTDQINPPFPHDIEMILRTLFDHKRGGHGTGHRAGR
jgi:hypothetical protein